jgi:hypothetical protein
MEGLQSAWWALIPAGSIVVVIGAVELESDSATWLSYLALVAVPPLAAFALGALVHRAKPIWAWAVLPLFVLAWAAKDSPAGEAAATALSGLGCITLGWLLVCVVPARWLRLGVYAMAVIDTIYVSADLLQEPNAVLNVAVPAADLPQLQAVHFGHARMGFGDLFVAALVGCLLAASKSRQLRAAALVALLALTFDLLFFAVDTLPATVPVALALALVVWCIPPGATQTPCIAWKKRFTRGLDQL